MSNELLFGTSRRTITPQVPISLAGYFNLRMWDSVKDDLEVRVLTLKQGDKNFLLVQFDLITVNTFCYNKLFAAIADLPQFTKENTIFTATHSHTAPDVNPESKGGNLEYIEFFVAKASEAIHEAVANMSACTLSTAMAYDERFLFNRRYWMADGNVVTNPGKLNPYIVAPEGAEDADIPLAALSVDGKVKVLLANIVNHTDTIGGTRVSADWVGVTRTILEAKLGKDSMVMPLIGCAGNINHFDVKDIGESEDEAKRIGIGYAETIAAAMGGLVEEKCVELKTAFREVKVGKCYVSEAELADAKATVAKYPEESMANALGSDVELTSEDLANGLPRVLVFFANAVLAADANKNSSVFNLTGLSLGNFVITTLPSEPFVEIGLDIRKRYFANRHCMVLSHVNGTGYETNYGGYIPNSWNYGRGGYETTVLCNPFARDTADKLRNAWCDVQQKNEL